MIPLDYIPRIRQVNGRQEIFDGVRKKYVALTPEESVRQQLVHWLVHRKDVPSMLMRVEVGIYFLQKKYRADLVVYDRCGEPLLMAECKAPGVEITPEVFKQIARYNMVLKAPYLLVSNGEDLYFCCFDAQHDHYRFEEKMPLYEELIQSAWI